MSEQPPNPVNPEQGEQPADEISQPVDMASSEQPPVTPGPEQPPDNPSSEQPPVTPVLPSPVPAPPAPMPPDKKAKAKPRRRGSVFFPLLLIVLGGALLLNNLGLIPGTMWDTLFNLWPVIFIAWGLDSIWRNEGLTGAVFLLGLGTVFLLGNFGYLQFSPWQVLLTIWPVLLVAIGFDILVSRRRSWWLTLIGLFLVAVIMVGALWLAGVRMPGTYTITGEQVSYGLQGATRAEVSLMPSSGTLLLDGLADSQMLLTGVVPEASDNYRVIQEFSKTGDLARLRLQASGLQFQYAPGEQNEAVWQLNLTESVPVDLRVELGAGEATLDLTGVQLSELTYNMGVGQATITLPETGRFNASIEGAVGRITIVVPAGMTVQLNSNTVLTGRSLPADYIKLDSNTFVAPGFDSAENRIVLDVGLVIGQVTIESD